MVPLVTVVTMVSENWNIALLSVIELRLLRQQESQLFSLPHVLQGVCGWRACWWWRGVTSTTHGGMR